MITKLFLPKLEKLIEPVGNDDTGVSVCGNRVGKTTAYGFPIDFGCRPLVTDDVDREIVEVLSRGIAIDDDGGYCCIWIDDACGIDICLCIIDGLFNIWSDVRCTFCCGVGCGNNCRNVFKVTFDITGADFKPRRCS